MMILAPLETSSAETLVNKYNSLLTNYVYLEQITNQQQIIITSQSNVCSYKILDLKLEYKQEKVKITRNWLIATAVIVTAFNFLLNFK